MYRFTLILLNLILWCTCCLFAQGTTIQNQFAVNPFIYNPAWAGSSDYLQINGGI